MTKLNDILNEIKIQPSISNIDLLDKMIKYRSDRDGSLLEVFIIHDSFEKWYYNDVDEDNLEAYDEDIILAKMFFKWVENKDLIHERIEDIDEKSTTLLSKRYKRMITYGMGYNDARVILTTF